MAPLNVGVGLGIRPPQLPKPPGQQKTPPDVAAFRNFPAAGGWSVLSHPGVAQQFTQHNVGLFAPGGPGPGTPHPGTVPNAQHPTNSATAQPGASSPGSPGDPALDATYYANVAANNFKVNNDVNSLNLQGSQAGTALQQALGQLAYQQPRDQLALEQKANQGGGLYSSVYDQNLGSLGRSYLDKQTAAQQDYTNTLDKIGEQIAAAQGGIPIYNAQQAADSAGRAARLAALNPGLGQGTGGLNTNPGGTTPGSTPPPSSHPAGNNAGRRLTVSVGTALGGRRGLNVGRTLPTLSGRPSAPSRNPPTTIRRSGIPGHGVVRTRLGGR